MTGIQLLAQQSEQFLEGFDQTPVRRKHISKDRYLHFHRLLEATRRGSVLAKAQLMVESQTTSDFPLMFADTLDRVLLAQYQEAPYSWSQYAKRGTVRDFRAVKRFAMDGNRGLLEKVGGANVSGSYPERSKQEAKYEYAVETYGAKIGYSWQAFINDDLGALSGDEQNFSISARRTEENYATKLFADPVAQAAFYTTNNKNKVTGNPALTITGLQTAMTQFANILDTDSQPIMVEAVTLVVPPALEIVARNILNATELRITAAGGGGAFDTTTGTGGNQELIVSNWMRNRVSLAVNYQLPLVDTNFGSTGWYLFANPSVGRPAMEIGFLRGHEAPELFMKSPNATRVGGGNVNPMDGDFDNDELMFKIRHTFGGTMMDPKMSVFSEGDNS